MCVLYNVGITLKMLDMRRVGPQIYLAVFGAIHKTRPIIAMIRALHVKPH